MDTLFQAKSPAQVPHGVVEVSGSVGGGKTQWVVDWLAANPQLRVAWVEEVLTVYPFAFLQKKVALERVLFVETPRYLWAAQQLLKSQIFGAVVLSAQVSQEIELRRLQLAAEKSGASLILLCERATRQGAWPIAAQFHVSRNSESEELELEIIKYRGGFQWSGSHVKSQA